MLSAAQQSVAVLVYVKSRLIAEQGDHSLLQDPFFLANLDYNFCELYGLYGELYGHQHDCLESLVALTRALAESWRDRPEWLKQNDKNRLLKSNWYTSNKMIGGTCYIDLYAKNIRGLRDQIPYFREMGLTYLHVQPPYKRPGPTSAAEEGVSATSYRQTEEHLGSMYEVSDLAKELHSVGISLALDIPLSYTSSQHEWARKASDGESEHSAFYWMYSDRTGPEAFERSTDSQGSFSQLRDGRWVWSKAGQSQWLLNYSSAAVLRAMTGEILCLANSGTGVFHLEGVNSTWKTLGTSCVDLPEAVDLLRILNIMCKIAAPSVLLQDASNLHTSRSSPYVGTSTCQIATNSLQMSLSWEALATRKVCMLQQALERWHSTAEAQKGHWMNFVRTNETLSWLFSDQDAHEQLIDPGSHRRFLNAFYIKRYPGSFARGLAFENEGGTCTISGTTASLAGLESGEEHAVERILLLYSIAFSTGGIPMITLGDEVGQLNDYLMPSEKGAEEDSRWVHRPAYPSKGHEEKRVPHSTANRLFHGMRQLIELRKKTDELAGGKLVGFFSGNEHVLGYQRFSGRSRLVILCNFNDYAEHIKSERFAATSSRCTDLITGKQINVREDGLHLSPHQYAWLRCD